VTLSRRALLAAAPLAATPRAAWAQRLSSGVFTHGVASGDPLPDGVVIWSRFVSAEGALTWEIAEDDAFTSAVQRGHLTATPVSDYCVKADVRGLAPGRRYFYRFLSAAGASETGETRTAPQTGADSLTVALVSCANYAFGHFHAYAYAAARDDVDLVLHAGDYIYEYGRGTYPSTAEAVPGRVLDPNFETVALADYYRRYATYHADPALLELRRRKPISAVWDDHEIANDASHTGAQNHQRNEGAYVDRVAAAAKAYFDWMPIRRPDPARPRMYRSLDWGDLARIVLLDTRLAGRDRQLDYRRAIGLRQLQGGPQLAPTLEEFRRTVLEDSSRTLLGHEQEAWAAEALARSAARGQRWQIVAQQVVMGPQLMPADIAGLLPSDAHGNTRRFVNAAVSLGALGMPWNLDAWDGYPAARDRFLQACAASRGSVVVLGGDSHNCWLNALPAPGGEGRLAAIEFAGGSVSSPGLERTFSGGAPGDREAAMRSANPHLAWCDASRRGCGVLRFTRHACEAEWIGFDDVRGPAAGPPHVTRFSAEPSAGGGVGAWSVEA